MNEFYDWLYTNYVRRRLDEDTFEEGYQLNKQKWLEVIETLPADERILSLDMMSSVKYAWGERAFAYGVQVGMMLLEGLPEKENLMECLTTHAAQ